MKKTIFITGCVLSLASNVQAFDTYGMTAEQVNKMRAKIDREQSRAEQERRINKKVEPKVDAYRKELYKKELDKKHQHRGK